MGSLPGPVSTDSSLGIAIAAFGARRRRWPRFIHESPMMTGEQPDAQ